MTWIAMGAAVPLLLGLLLGLSGTGDWTAPLIGGAITIGLLLVAWHAEDVARDRASRAALEEWTRHNRRNNP